jgi:hypothetical protein
MSVNLSSNANAEEFLFAMIATDEIDKLTWLYGAILKWDQESSKEFDEFQIEAKKRHSDLRDQYGYDPVEDEAFMLRETMRVMLANLGVSIAACAENFIVSYCKARGLNCLNSNGQTEFGIACGSLSKALKVEISKLPGYKGNQRARLLGNCFKHSESQKNDRFVEKFGGTVGEEIEYEKENWPSLIEETRTLLLQITRLGTCGYQSP